MNKSLMIAIGLLLGGTGAMAQDVMPALPEKINQYFDGSVFEDFTEESGIRHIGHGKCVAMGDYDNDGDLDVYMSVVYGENKFYMNNGDMTFVDLTQATGTGDPGDTHGIVFADFNNDGLLDIFTANNTEALSKMRGYIMMPNSLYMGNDEGYYNIAAAAGLAGNPLNYSCGVTTADVNGDGILDLYVAKGGYRRGYDGATNTSDCANSLYVSAGNNVWVDMAVQAGVADMGNGYCAAFSDYDNDGDPDLAVGNLNDSDEAQTVRLYRNDGKMKFTDMTAELGIESKGYTVSLFWGDVDNDGDQDLFFGNSNGMGSAAPLEYGKNKLWRNNGDGTFTDASRESGVDVQTNTRGCTMGDIDNDGDLDIIATNSRADSLVLVNDGTGKFRDMAAETGGAVYYGHGLSLGDLDDDGDLDLLEGNWRRPSVGNPGDWKAFRNKTNDKAFLKVNVAGTASNRSGVMTKLAAFEAGAAGDIDRLIGMREVTAGNGTFPGNPLQAHFGLGDARRVDIVAIFPSGRRVTLEGVAAGETVKIEEPAG